MLTFSGWRGASAAAALAATTILSAGHGAQAQTELEFWDMIWGPSEYITTAQQIVEEFNDSHPDIHVEYRSVPWNNWYQTYVTAVSSGSAPDLSTGAGYQAVQLYELGGIRPIDEVIAAMRADGDTDDFASGAVDTLQFDDHYVALPWGLDIRVWYYRPSMLEAAGIEIPTTWDEFRDAAKALSGDGKFGVVASGDTGGSHYVLSSILNNGGGLFDDEGNLAFSSDPRNVEAVEWLSSMVADGSVHPASPGYSSDDRRAAFFQGDAAFMMDSPNIYSRATPEVNADIAVLPPLKGPHGDVGTIFWVNNIMMYEQTEHPAEAGTFLRWWSEHELPLWTEGHTGQIPARKSFVADAAAGDERYQFVIDNYIPIAKTTATSANGIFPQLSEVEGEGVLQTLAQQIFQGVPADEAMAKADARLTEIMN